uniref:Protein kinase domain-containing protein n=1 Tax=Ciona savignyi TaxID=51511 RepID=H2YWL3_CIOSA
CSIKRGEYSFPEEQWSGISNDAKDLISHLIVRDRSLRYNAHQILEHPWIKGTASETPLSTPLLLSRRDSSTHDLTQFAAHAVAYERKLACNDTTSITQGISNIRLSPPGTSALAQRRRGEAVSSISESDEAQGMSTSDPNSPPTDEPLAAQSCAVVARMVNSSASKATLGFGLKSIQGS